MLSTVRWLLRSHFLPSQNDKEELRFGQNRSSSFAYDRFSSFLKIVCQGSRLRDSFGFVYITDGVHAGHKYLTHNRPFVQGGGALKG